MDMDKIKIWWRKYPRCFACSIFMRIVVFFWAHKAIVDNLVKIVKDSVSYSNCCRGWRSVLDVWKVIPGNRLHFFRKTDERNVKWGIALIWRSYWKRLAGKGCHDLSSLLIFYWRGKGVFLINISAKSQNVNTECSCKTLGVYSTNNLS